MSLVSPYSCLEDLIGLSRTQCECYDEAPTDNSLSGLYIDELASLRSVNALLNCEDGNDIWDYLIRSRELAMTQFYTDFSTLLLQHYKVKRQPFTGIMGKLVQGRNAPYKQGEYAIHRMFMADIVNGYFKIKRIGTKFDKTGTIDLTIADNIDGTIETIELDTTANTLVWNTVDLELPTHSDLVNNIEYYLYYQMDDKVPAQVSLSGCKCNYYFDSVLPKFQTQTNKAHGYNAFMMTGGNKMVNIDLPNLPHRSNNYYFGIVFDVEIKCMTNYLLCQDFDFETNMLARSIAMALWYKAGYNLASRLTKGENLNRWSQVDYEMLREDMKLWDKKYVELISYIVDTIDVKTDDCIACKDKIEIRRSGILV